MIVDLAGQGEIAAEADFVVIGAGTAGLPVSVMLARTTGRRVICIESGAEHQHGETHPLNAVEQLGSVYDGAEAGRFRCLGGTSTRWGGALIPFQAADLDHGDWPLTLADLEPFVPEVEALFGLEPGAYADPAFPFDLGAVHVNRLAKWPPFKRRNVAALLGGECRALPNLTVYLNATVTGLHAEGESAVRLEARSPGGDGLTVRAPRAIIAAGAIETTRLALLADRQNGGAIARVSPLLGRTFTDHVSVPVGEIAATRARALNRIVGFRFGRGGAMRNIRFELAPGAAERATLPPGFAHVGFESDRPGGFDALREIFRLLQQRRLPGPGPVLDLLRHAPWLARAVWWRFAERRLVFPDAARLVLHMVVEQVPHPDNRIALSERQTDPFGQPLGAIDWRVRDADIANLIAATDLFEQTWQRTGFAALGELRRYPREQVVEGLHQSTGIFHPTGSTRMGADPASGVVDRDLRLFALPQVQLLATSVLPTGGGANPTMMLMLLAMRCVAQHRAAPVA